MITKAFSTSRAKSLSISLVLGFVLLVLNAALPTILTVSAAPQTFIVTNTNDTGAGSFRQAVIDANTNGNPSDQDVIEFDISTGSELDKRIASESTITITESVLIDGYTQTGAEENTTAWPAPFDGTIRVEIFNDISDGGISIQSDDVTIKGLAINHSHTSHVEVIDSDNVVLAGNFIGITFNGYEMYSPTDNEGALIVESSSNLTVGGDQPEDRNIIGGCIISCIGISGTIGDPSQNNTIQGNNIGVGIDGITQSSMYQGGVGIRLTQYVEDTQIGGTDGVTGNNLHHNTGGAIWAQDTSGVTIQGNRIMNNWSYTPNGATEGAGITFGGVTDSIIGGSEENAGNVIAGNNFGSINIRASEATSAETSNIVIEGNTINSMDDQTTVFDNNIAGVIILDASEYIHIKSNHIHNTYSSYNASAAGVIAVDDASNISLSENSIYNSDGLGFTFDFNSAFTDNDSGDTDTGVNDLLNHPTYFDITESGGNTTISYSYDGPIGDYRIEFFSNTEADASGYDEGENFLGTEDIERTTSDVEFYEFTVSGTGHENITLNATEIDVSSPNGFGATSLFGQEGAPPPPVTDIAIEKKLLNPEDLALGEVLDYEITLYNDGPDSIDIGVWEGTSPGVDHLFFDLLPPEITFESISTSEPIGCSSFGAGSAAMFGPALGDHSDYEAVMCGYNGGTRILEAGEGVTVVISTTVIDDSDLDFTNYVLSNASEYDPDYATIVDVGTSGNDVITTYESLVTPNNNFYSAKSVFFDTEVNKILLNEEEIVDGSTLNYQLEFISNGPEPVDLTYFDSSGVNPILTSLFIDILPDNLTFLGSSNPDINCFVAGPASLAPYFFNHTDYNIVLCSYTGSETDLEAGESLSTTLLAELSGEPAAGLTNYLLSGLHPDDPDFYFMYYKYAKAADNAFNDGEDDIFDLLGTSERNFSFAVLGSEDSNENNENTTNSTNGNNGSLAETGQRILFIGLVAAIVTTSLLIMPRKLVKNSS